jgi:alginate O-acetyltransferase complex protein AlgI
MLFNSIDFAIFLPLVFVLYWLIFAKQIMARNSFLIAVSYLFYGWWDWRFLSLIIISSQVDFFIGKRIAEELNRVHRKRLLWISLAVNLGILGFFKYCNFFIDSFTSAFTFFGGSMESMSLNILLPVGISFYTFQTLSYTLDIYYDKIKPEKDVVSFFAFVSFFPQLVAGPIERAKHLLPQFLEHKKPNYELFRSGLLLMAWGFFKKIVIADRLGRYVNNVHLDIASAEGFPAVIAMIFFGFQVYLDFSAYSDIGIGCARIFGFDLRPNFKRPYLATSFSDFWTRWHISLSSWFKDYVYIPLGGNRGTQYRTTRNIAIVFVLSGLWHGASWTYVIWGAVNGVFILVLEGLFSKASNTGISRVFKSVGITLLWMLALILFRSGTMLDAVTMYQSLGFGNIDNLYSFGLLESEFKFTILLLALFIAFEIWQEFKTEAYPWFTSKPVALRWAVYLGLACTILLLGSYGIGLNDSNFIYFQF